MIIECIVTSNMILDVRHFTHISDAPYVQWQDKYFRGCLLVQFSPTQVPTSLISRLNINYSKKFREGDNLTYAHIRRARTML